MAKGDKPRVRITAVLKDDKSVRFDIGAAWPSPISDDILNLKLDRNCAGIKCEPRAGGKPVVLSNDNAYFQIEPPYSGGGKGGADSAADDDGDF